jgi:hypothetical protein
MAHGLCYNFLVFARDPILALPQSTGRLTAVQKYPKMVAL